MRTITEIAIQFSRLQRIKSFSSTLNRNLIPHLQFSLFHSHTFPKKSIGRTNSEFAFLQDCVREYWHDLGDLGTCLSYDRNLARFFLFRLFPLSCVPSYSYLRASPPPPASHSLSLSFFLISFLFLHDKSSIKYLRFACTCEICGDILTISICTRYPTVDSWCSVLDKISIYTWERKL